MIMDRGVPLFFLLIVFVLFASEAQAQVQLFQHLFYTGWSVNFPEGSFNRAALLARGGTDNAATSIKVAPGFKATLYRYSNFKGTSIVKTEDDPSFVNDKFNNMATSLRVERINVVELFDRCNYGGWRANFPIGIFKAADIVKRGGVNNGTSSVKIKRGFKATLFVDDKLTGRYVVLHSGYTACLTGFNNVLSSMIVEPDPKGQCVLGDRKVNYSPKPPPTIHDWIGDHDQKGSIMTLDDYDQHVVVYTDNHVDRRVIGWVKPFVSRSLRYMKHVYDPQFHYGPDRLYAFLHQRPFALGTFSSYFDVHSSFRNAADVCVGNWSVDADNRIARDMLSHVLCNVVEGSSNGVHDSPGFTVWGNSKWGEFFEFDLYKGLGEEQDATRVFGRFLAIRDNFPASNVAWFKDWFLPLWIDGGGKCRGGEIMARFFRLLKQHFPKKLENGGRNQIYTRRLNLGELVHFTSGAAGKDLSRRAQEAFGSGFNRAQFDQARRNFPKIVY